VEDDFNILILLLEQIIEFLIVIDYDDNIGGWVTPPCTNHAVE
jgi:hypothetical protein